MKKDLGKLRKTTNKKCPDCGKPIQVRVSGEKEVLSCSHCDYEETIQKKRIRRREEDD